MITIRVDDASRILIIEMTGTVSEADIDGAADRLQRDYPGVGVHLKGQGTPFSILADWRGLEGWEKRAKTFGTVLSKATGDAAKKVAVVADGRFADEQPRIADALPGAAVRFFPPSQSEQAMAWLRGN